jgi:hypothetical protein
MERSCLQGEKQVASGGRGAQESATQRKEAAQQVHAVRQDAGDLTEFYSTYG